MSPEQAQWVEILGRILMGSLFVIGGLHHLPIFAELSKHLSQRGVPLPWAALELIGFTIAASLLLLNFWSMEGEARAGAQNQFLTNVAVVGGLLYAAAA